MKTWRPMYRDHTGSTRETGGEGYYRETGSPCTVYTVPFRPLNFRGSMS